MQLTLKRQDLEVAVSYSIMQGMTLSFGFWNPACLQYFFATVNLTCSGVEVLFWTTQPVHWHWGGRVFSPLIHWSKRNAQNEKTTFLVHFLTAGKRRGGAVVIRALALPSSHHQCGPGWIPKLNVMSRLSFVLYSAPCREVWLPLYKPPWLPDKIRTRRSDFLYEHSAGRVKHFQESIC